jgi:hypothetical protein
MYTRTVVKVTLRLTPYEARMAFGVFPDPDKVKRALGTHKFDMARHDKIRVCADGGVSITLVGDKRAHDRAERLATICAALRDYRTAKLEA